MSGKYDNSSKCKCCVQLKQFSNYLQQNPFVIISGIPGIGKTVLMKQICRTALTNDFILFVTLVDHYDYFENNEKSFRTPIEHLLYFCKNENAILKDFIQQKAQRNEIVILFDGFDEIAPRYTKIVSKIINQFREQNYKTILTTRSVLKEKVEKIFGVLAITLTPFNIKEQEIFMQNYLNKCGSALLDYSKYESIIMNSIENDNECFRVPLNIQLISELIFNKIRLGYQLDEYYTFNELEFYENFIELKFEVVKKFNRNIDKSMIEGYHKYFSIRMLFSKIPNYKIIETELTSELKVYTKQLENGLEKVGLLIGDINEVFIHRTAAEYFSAKWLYDVFVVNDNLELIEGEKEFAHFIMKIVNLSNKNGKDDNFNFPVVRLFFDLMINQNELHKAATKDNCQYIKEILNSEIPMVKTLNNFNRNVLFTIILSNNDSYEPYNKWLDIIRLLLNNFKDILIEKDYSQTSILDYVQQKTLMDPPLKIIIHNIADRHVIYYNRRFDLWEIFRSENLYACDIQHLIDVIKDPQTTFSAIFQAAKNQHLCVIDRFYSSGIDMNIIDGSERHLLHFAAEGGSLNIIKNRSTYGIQENISVLDEKGRSLIHFAVVSGNIDLINYLIENQLDLISCDEFGLSAFNYAIIFNKVDVVKSFIKDIYVNFPNNRDYFPIQYAAAFCNMEMFKLLLENGANMNGKSVKVETFIPLITFINCWATKTIVETDYVINKDTNDKIRTNDKRCIDFVKFLIAKGCDINFKFKDGSTPFLAAVAFGNNNVVEYLIESIREKNNSNKVDGRALHFAAFKNRDMETIKLLLKYNININFLDNNKNSVLHYALINYNVSYQMVDFLIKNGANPISANNEGMTPLHFAIELNEIEAAILLIDHMEHTKLNVKTIEGNTPLHYAVYYDLIDIVKYLFEKKAEVNLSNARNLTPLDIALIKRRRTIISYLKQNNATSSNWTKYNKNISHLLEFTPHRRWLFTNFEANKNFIPTYIEDLPDKFLQRHWMANLNK